MKTRLCSLLVFLVLSFIVFGWLILLIKHPMIFGIITAILTIWIFYTVARDIGEADKIREGVE